MRTVLTVQLCIHCKQRPAGFWVSRGSDRTVRRPWCRACCGGLDLAGYDMTPFGGSRARSAVGPAAR
jgi:hypothetical protein